MHRHAPRLLACHDDWGSQPKVSHVLAFLIFTVLAAPRTVHGRLSAEGDQLVITIPVAKLRRDNPSHPLLDLPENAKVLIDVGTHRVDISNASAPRSHSMGNRLRAGLLALLTPSGETRPPTDDLDQCGSRRQLKGLGLFLPMVLRGRGMAL